MYKNTHIKIDNTNYRISNIIKFLIHLIYTIFIMGGFLYLGASISIFTQSLSINLSFWFLILLTILILLIIHFLIVYISPLVEIKDNQDSKNST